MSREKQIDEMPLTDVDILANDINQHCPDLAETYCGDTHCVACLAHALTAKGYRKASEVAKEVIDEFLNAMRKKHEEQRRVYGGALALLLPDIEQISKELKKKYTEEGK